MLNLSWMLPNDATFEKKSTDLDTFLVLGQDPNDKQKAAFRWSRFAIQLWRPCIMEPLMHEGH
jgi:hypothetical protein